jgi:hypothetical protein
MKTLSAIAILSIAPGLFAQDRMTDTLKKGILEEESRQNLAAAIKSYESVLAQYDEARKTAATALFRLAESYRKQGDEKRASASYARMVHDFPDQTALVERSRKYVPSDMSWADDAAATFRETLWAKLALVEASLNAVKQKYQLGSVDENVVRDAEMRVLDARQAVAAFDMARRGMK